MARNNKDQRKNNYPQVVFSKSESDEEFRTLEILEKKIPRQKRFRKRDSSEVMPPRADRMPIDQDWSNVWPTAESFKPSVVPIPVRMGYPNKSNPSPHKYGNAELMKIPNFLHLTPPAIKKHCAAIKKFCTQWPEALKSDEDCEKLFPVDRITSDYCNSGFSIRDPRARIVIVKVKVSSWNLDYHAHDKLIRLVGDRYNKKTDILTIVTDRCPLRKQNFDYAIYLLTVLYHEARKFEPWESEKTNADMEKYFWDINQSSKNIIELISRIKDVELKQTSKESENEANPASYMSELTGVSNNEEIVQIKEVKEYATSVEELHNEGENKFTLHKYKDSVNILLNLPAFDSGAL